MDDASGNRGAHVAVTEFTGEFDGNNDTDAADGGPYSISNLSIDVEGISGDHSTGGNSGNYHIGLFGKLGGGGTIRNLTLKNASVNHDSSATTDPNTPKTARVGAVVGEAVGDVEFVTVSGSVSGNSSNTSYDPNFLPGFHSGSLALGGVVGELSPNEHQHRQRPRQRFHRVRRLQRAVHPGQRGRSSSARSTAARYWPPTPPEPLTRAPPFPARTCTPAGLWAAFTAHSPPTHPRRPPWSTTTPTGAVSASGGSPVAGGLVGRQEGNIKYSYSIGVPSTTSGGGLVGSRGSGATTDSYWDTQTSGITSTGQGTGKTTSQLQTPTGYTGIYANWSQDLDPDTSGTQDAWYFGTTTDYAVHQVRLRGGLHAAPDAADVLVGSI